MLAQRIVRRATTEHDLLRLGASCLRISAERALGSSDPYAAARAWNECALGEQQIRMATFRALKKGIITNFQYDQLFLAATAAVRAREREIGRLRERLLDSAWV